MVAQSPVSRRVAAYLAALADRGGNAATIASSCGHRIAFQDCC